jgi:hypothetical protein
MVNEVLNPKLFEGGRDGILFIFVIPQYLACGWTMNYNEILFL